MKKLFLFLMVGFLLASVTSAGVRVPLDTKGNSLNTVDWIGATPCNIDIATGTVAVGCGTAGPAIVYGIIASSIAATNFVVFRDSATPNATSSTATIVYAAGTGSNSSGSNTTQFFKFPVPLKFSNGISINANAAPVVGAVWTILYRTQAQSTNE